MNVLRSGEVVMHHSMMEIINVKAHNTDGAHRSAVRLLLLNMHSFGRQSTRLDINLSSCLFGKVTS